MNRITALVVMLAAVCTAESEFREFTVYDGRMIEAQLIAFDAQRGRVVLLRKDRKRIPVKIGIFDEEDQTYIHEWNAAQLFGTASKFKLSLKQEKLRQWEEEAKARTRGSLGRGGGGGGGGGGSRDSGGGGREESVASTTKKTEYRYDLLIDNQTGVALKDLTVDYRIFYKQETPVNSGRRGGRGGRGGSTEDSEEDKESEAKARSEDKVAGGTSMIEAVVVKEKKLFQSDTVTISESTNIDAKMVGAWFKLKMTGPDGETIERNVSFPSGLSEKYAWTELSEAPVREEKKRRDARE